MMPNVRVFAKNFRGFQWIYVDLDRNHFLVGDNSSGKSSALHLVDAVLRSKLTSIPSLREGLGVGAHDYFSPFFDYADVTFGFSIEGSHGRSMKIATFRRNKEFQPECTAVSYAGEGLFITMRKTRKGLKKRFCATVDATVDQLLEQHGATSGFALDVSPLANQVNILEPATALLAFRDVVSKNSVNSTNESGTSNFLEKFFKVISFDLPKSVFVGPVRSLPAKFYERRRTKSASGLHFADLWMNIEKNRAENLSKAVNDFGKESGLFEALHVRKVNSRLSDSPLVVTAERSGKEFFINQLGVGLSQVVPILAEAVFCAGAPKEYVLLVQQPELHLHPVAQAALGTFFFKLSAVGLTSIIETHSSFMMDRYRSELRDSKVVAKDTEIEMPRILFCQNNQRGNAVTAINCNASGELIDAPHSYFNFFLDEIMRTMF